MSSPYIEGSKHGPMTQAIEDHFGTAKKRAGIGETSGKGMPLYGDSQFNPEAVPGIPDGSGFNYEPKSDTGHKTR